jgi:DNA polymerase-3 subunit alpha
MAGEKTLKSEFIINQQKAENEGHRLMISGILAGLHYFADAASVYFKDLNQKDEAQLGNHKVKIYTRDAMADEDMLIYDDYYQAHTEITLYILCKIKAGNYQYIGYIDKPVVDQTRVVQMIGQDSSTASKKIRRIFAEQYKPITDLFQIFEEAVEKKIKSEFQKYFPLHLHTEYSIGDGFGKSSYIAQKLSDKGFAGSAITDHGTLAGVWEFQKALLEQNLKPIIGCEFYVKLAKGQEHSMHIVLLVKNDIGWKNILKLQSLAVREGFYYRPIILLDQLFSLKQGLIALSACSSGIISKLIEQGNIIDAKLMMQRFKQEFAEDYYVEMMIHQIGDNQGNLHQQHIFAQELNIKCVFTTDTHYSELQDKKYHEAVKAINYKGKYGTAGFGDDCFYLLQDQDIIERLKDKAAWQLQHIDKFKANTFEVANKCNFLIKKADNQDTMPQITFTGQTQEEAFKQKCIEGLKKYTKYEYSGAIKERLDLEINRMTSKGYTNYFLIVADMISWAKQQGIRVGPGRGSVGASLAALCLNITETDPIEHDLLFDRFISEIRRDQPDVDMDYQDTRREEVFQYLRDKYGVLNCAKVVTYSRFHGKGIMRDIGRIYGIPVPEIEKINGMIIERSGGDARASFTLMDTFLEFAEAKKFAEKYPEAVDVACKLEGHIRHKGVHAAAMVTTAKDIAEYIPIGKVNGEIVTEWEKQLAEDIGLIKFDILGLATLTLIDDCISSSGAVLPKTFDDIKVYETVFQKGKTLGVFQFNTTGMTKFAQQLQVADFNTLYDATTLYRPGCLHSGQTQVYANRKLGKESIEYMHPSLEPITKNTQGTILYQEQIMQIMHQVGRMSWATAEMARKVITKSKGKDAFNKMRAEFVRNAESFHNMPAEEAEKIYDVVSTFGSYGFNKAHAVEYSIISYWCAWLKTYYPKYYYKSLLKYEQDEAIIQEAMQEAESLGITIHFPDVNLSAESYDICQDEIYAGLNSIVGIGTKMAQKIIRSRPYTSVSDFQKRAKISDKVFKGLIIADAFRAFKPNKRAYVIDRHDIDQDYTEVEHAQLIYQLTTLKPRLDVLKAYDFGNYAYVNIISIKQEMANTIQHIRGIVTQVINKDKLLRHELREHQLKFEEHMIYLNVNDGTGNIAVQINPATYEQYQDKIGLFEKQPLSIIGRISHDGKKMYADIIQMVSKEHRTYDIDKIVATIQGCKKGEAVILSAQPAVSKNKKS